MNLEPIKMGGITITGHTGYLGSALFERLSEADEFDVCGISRSNGFDLEQPDALDGEDATDTIIHLAGKTGVPESWDDPVGFYRANVLTTLTALQFANRNHARFIYLSSYVYGKPQYQPVDEQHPIACGNPYARSKYQGELLCSGYADDFGLPVRIVRLFNVFGPGQSIDYLVPHVINQAVAGDEIKVKDLAPKRDYLWIGDVVDALYAIIKKEWDGFDIYNLGFGTAASVADITDTVIGITGPKTVIEEKQVRPNEIDDCACDNSKFREFFDWVPRTSLSQGIASIIESDFAR